ncbi:Rrf2 family transcriptional regulator [Armatimonadota bacterium]|nr:Rrf2 family transcriptional regulator [Armatimonadota bacterium]
MSFFNSKLRYALCAAADLATQPKDTACQSREIAARQEIPGPYLDQILASLKSAGIVRSVRGAGGGYTLARPAERITVEDIARAVLREDKLVTSHQDSEPIDYESASMLWVVREFEEKAEALLTSQLNASTLSDLVRRKQSINDSLSFMPSI